MKCSPYVLTLLAPMLATSLFSPDAAAEPEGFIEDAKGSMTLRSYYMNRNYVKHANTGQAEAWTQSFILDMRSGFTQGTLGFGVDVLGLWAVKLDGGAGSGGTDLLPVHHDGSQAKDFGRLAIAPRMRFAKTEIKVGEWVPRYPILYAEQWGRSLPQTFQGGEIRTNDIENLTLLAGQFQATSLRAASGMQDMTAFGAKSDRLNYAAAEYTFNDKRTLVGLWNAQLKDIYNQQYLQFTHSQPIADWLLGAQMGYYVGRDDGSARAGKLDNQTYSGFFSAHKGPHTLYIGLQKISGSSDWMGVDGTSSTNQYLANHSFNSKFDAAGERSWQLRYDFNLAALGIPGLVLMNRYIKGDNVHARGVTGGREYLRETELAYTIQEGTLKDLDIRWRNGTERRSWMPYNFDENRLTVSYPVSLF